MEMSIQDLIRQTSQNGTGQQSLISGSTALSQMDSSARLGLKKRTLSLDSTSYDAKTISNDRILNVLCGMS